MVETQSIETATKNKKVIAKKTKIIIIGVIVGIAIIGGIVLYISQRNIFARTWYYHVITTSKLGGGSEVYAELKINKDNTFTYEMTTTINNYESPKSTYKGTYTKSGKYITLDFEENNAGLSKTSLIKKGDRLCIEGDDKCEIFYSNSSDPDKNTARFTIG